MSEYLKNLAAFVAAFVMDKVRSEPVVVANVVTALVGLLAYVGFDMDGESTAVLVGAVMAVLTVLARGQVSPVKKGRRKRQ